jgi:hypothetical protein
MHARISLVALLALSACGSSDDTADMGAAVVDLTGGLPCDVDQLLATRCRSCHSAPPIGLAPMALVTRADLLGPAKTDPTKRVIELAITRMEAMATPMPPVPATAPAANEIATLKAWVAAGFPKGTCMATGTAANPYGTADVCTSMQMWSGGDRGSQRMHPGGPCIDCHSSFNGPFLTIGGTVYPTAHEPDDCNGANGVFPTAVQVIIVDASNNVLTLTPNPVGNFFSQDNVDLPYRAKVVANGRERVMTTAQMSGDCNSCHGDTGMNSAPGRIMLP